ncbi:threonine/serine exporter family protein [Isoptericola sp. b441]|uniref:Threonine/serine exporter family protein n=1 Tax=Actinotalea lenta TaxID=3064654 RepID=A0ABT9D5C3_9CELL|nr:threonine/serine exporter family protein [Isoptericola sp. b441]MDO8105961.1 threonine/serine exporter family protein [Isoptericola sp. b441]
MSDLPSEPVDGAPAADRARRPDLDDERARAVLRSENDLEPVELIRMSGTVLRMGKAMLSTGHGSYRVKAAMAQVARSLGIDRHEAHVTLTEITATSHRGPIFRTEVAEVRTIGVNADRLQALSDLANGMHAGVTVDEVNRDLDRIESKAPLYVPVINAASAGVACGAFAFLNNGGWVEIVGATLGAGLGQYSRRWLLHRKVNQFGATVVAAAVACLAYLAFVLALDAVVVGVASRHEAGFISSVLFLVPGFPLVTGALDLAKADFSAGVARVTYGMTILTSAALSVWAVTLATGLEADPIPRPDLSWWLMTVLRLVASFLGVLGFALMFNSPVRMAMWAASIGMVANVLRLALADGGLAIQAATMVATLVVAVLAAVVGPRTGIPRTALSVPAVVIMVPGVAAYRAVASFNNGQVEAALAAGSQAAFVVICIAMGLAAGRILTDRSWGFER